MKDFSLFLDCGAPSLYEKLSKKRKTKVMGSRFQDRQYNDYSYADLPEYYEYMTAYMDFLKENAAYIDIFSNLDVISNPKLTMRNQRLFEEQGLAPIPVFHLGSDERYLERYIKKYEYIAIGGLVPNPTRMLIPVLDRLWRTYLTDADGFPKVKVHGFACTSLTLMERYPWYSVDSASSQKLAMYGKIIQPNISGDDWMPISVSTRDIPMASRVSPLIMKAIVDSVQKYNISVEELGASIEKRFVYNHLNMLSLAHKVIPQWPWSFKDRKSKNRDYFRLYAAGVVQSFAWEETILSAEAIGIEVPMSRLDSFFYKSRAKKSITLKQDIENGNK